MRRRNEELAELVLELRHAETAYIEALRRVGVAAKRLGEACRAGREKTSEEQEDFDQANQARITALGRLETARIILCAHVLAHPEIYS